jgi:hypothetical protein
MEGSDVGAQRYDLQGDADIINLEGRMSGAV